MNKALSETEQLLRLAMGLDPASIGSSAVQRALHERLSARGLRSEPEYAALLRESPAELQQLVELVVVPETWFFRDREAFAALGSTLRAEWQRAGAHSRLQLLSLPCSTGEEPYSMAMALLDAGIPAERFQIDAVDISARAVALGQRAVYRKNSFRGADLSFRDRHFEAVDGGWRPHERVRAAVRFQQGNIFAPGGLPGPAYYDAIFCRNMLIYFDRFGQGEALRTLGQRLKKQGLLFVAAAETSLAAGLELAPLGVPLAFAFRKQAPAAPAAANAPSRVRAPAPAAAGMSAAALQPPPAEPETAAAAPTRSIDEALRLADLGRLAEAAEICEAHLRSHGPSAPALYLMGLVRDAAGDAAGAARYYRQTLYLEPAHQETLVHFALLLEKQGDHGGAELMRNRAKRQQRRVQGG